jgi:hypothetical protein
MANTSLKMLQPPTPNMWMHAPENFYRFLQEIWERTGGYNSKVKSLEGLTTTVEELNALSGIDTTDSVQEQINKKLSENEDVEVEFPPIYAQFLNNSATSNSGDFNDLKMLSYITNKNILNYAKVIKIETYGSLAANVHNKRIRLYLTNFLLNDSAIFNNSGGYWFVTSNIIRFDDLTSYSMSEFKIDNEIIHTQYTQINVNWADAMNIYCTGESNYAGDITNSSLKISYL